MSYRKSWSFTWDRYRNGQTVKNKKGKVLRTGNHFFSPEEAQEVWDRKFREGMAPSPIEEKELYWVM